jgi:hypothetical protein
MYVHRYELISQLFQELINLFELFFCARCPRTIIAVAAIQSLAVPHAVAVRALDHVIFTGLD